MKSILYVAVAVSLLGYALSSEPEDSPKERLIALYKTATYVTVSTSTVSRYYSCITMSAERQGLARTFWGIWRTATVTSVSVTTSTAFFTCSTASSNTACTGRRRRKRKAGITQKIVPEEVEEPDTPEIQTSVQTPDNAVDATGLQRDPRFILTITTSTTSVVTITSTSINNAIIVSVSVQMAERRTEQLQGSMIEQPSALSADTTDARLGFTVWTTSTSWLTLFTTSLNSATTVVITYLCTDSGTSTVPACG